MFKQVSVWLTHHLTNPARGFGAAAPNESIVYGARRPGFPFPSVATRTVTAWIDFMQAQQIAHVVCLLPLRQLTGYDDLLHTYRQRFGSSNVCWSPIDDFQLAEVTALTQVILPFLARAAQQQERVVVHCSGGIGRTGHVLAAWLVSFRGLSNEAAIETVRKMGRNPRESGSPRLDTLLDACRNNGAR